MFLNVLACLKSLPPLARFHRFGQEMRQECFLLRPTFPENTVCRHVEHALNDVAQPTLPGIALQFKDRRFHLELALRNLRRTQAVIRAARILPQP